jgi:choline dehydrogenase-like flavoprotein
VLSCSHRLFFKLSNAQWQVRERVASPTAEKAGSLLETYIQEVIKTYENPGGFVIGSVNASGSPTMEEGKIWRTYSTFDSSTGKRRSANTILNLDRENLSLLAKTEVTEILFDGDLGVPFARTTDTPRARCIRTAARGFFSPEQIICVREGGRIYITAGTILSAALLLKSGVGPGMRNVDNNEVRCKGVWVLFAEFLLTHFFSFNRRKPNAFSKGWRELQ